MVNVCFLKTTQHPPVIAQSRVKRDWMDATYNKHAYQCLPMTVANVSGWELRLEEEVVAEWDGHPNSNVTILSGATTTSGRSQALPNIASMVSFTMGWVLRTDEPYCTLMSGSPNYVLEGARPLTASIPSWWWPDTYEMNWALTKVNEPVIFPAGMPFAFISIYNPEDMINASVSSGSLWDDRELMTARAKYGQQKSKNQQENPWTWTHGIKTGVDADDKRIGPTFAGLPKLHVPNQTIS